MSAYTEANQQDYLVSTPHSPGLNFSTSAGLSCWLGAFPDADQAYASCTGPRPDMGGGDWKITARRNEPASAEVAPPPPNPNYIEPTPRALPPMHLLTDDVDQFCGVDDMGMTACRVGDHGFVLTPTSTKMF
jgi:hypothetical protein